MTDPIIVNDKQAILDMCLRNALRYAVGEMKYTRALGDQLQYALEHSNESTKQLLHDVFINRGILDD